jgi:membrane-associated phospholipid phosphatase
MIVCMVQQRKLDGIFDNPRRQRYLVYVLSSVLGALGVFIMWTGDAPHLLKTTFLTGFIAIIIFMMVNFFWKISLHTAFVSASATVLTLVYGALGALMFLALPAVAWSRIELNQHTPWQVLAGAVSAAAITLVVFWRAGYL